MVVINSDSNLTFCISTNDTIFKITLCTDNQDVHGAGHIQSLMLLNYNVTCVVAYVLKLLKDFVYSFTHEDNWKLQFQTNLQFQTIRKLKESCNYFILSRLHKVHPNVGHSNIELCLYFAKTEFNEVYQIPRLFIRHLPDGGEVIPPFRVCK